MKFPRMAAVALAALLTACGNPVPPARSAYVGEWHSPKMLLVISSDGFVRYARHDGKVSTRINAPIQHFEGDNFVVGVGFISTTFVVSRPPHREGAAWKMTVDGVELVRVGIATDTYAAASLRT